MVIDSSYPVRIFLSSKTINPTIQIYRKAVEFLIATVETEWASLQPVYSESPLQAKTMVEHLIHGTKRNPNPKYDFDTYFYKFPCYLRRAAIATALGAVSSYHSNLNNWNKNNQQGKPPRLTLKRLDMPTFYNVDMSKSSDMLDGKSDTVYLKLYHNNDWVWVPVQCRHQDTKYLARWWSSVKPSAPTLEVEHRQSQKKHYYLRYLFKEKRDLSIRDVPVQDQTVLAVDLGINQDAVCSVMTANGTILARKFINFPSDKDQLQHLLNKIKRLQRKHGRTGGIHEWTKANRINKQLAVKIANAIMDMAVLYNVHVIVFEHLDFQGKIKGHKKQRLALWKKQHIQQMVERKAHLNLMRVSRICAWGTSSLAFDGSGYIFRGRIGLTTSELEELIQGSKKEGRPETYCNQERCTFRNGKEYACDLSASYNIGARYFLRAFCYEHPELQEQLPKASKRTYYDLKTLNPCW